MAEAIQLPSVSTKYFCYQCDREVSVMPMPSAILTCPNCSTGFIEEVPDSPDYLDEDSADESEVDESELNLFNLLSIDDFFRRSILSSVEDEPDSPRSNTQSESSDRERDGPDPPDPVIEVISTRVWLQDIEDRIVRGHSSRMRHLGDYLFSEDLDALSTMLLNDTEISGPPPLPKDQIELLPKVTVSKEHIDKRIQCTICMEDFVIKEKATGLPCSHLYHEKCITPWLERHSTCPNCRKLVKIVQRKHHRSHSCPRRSDYNPIRNPDQRRSSTPTDSTSNGMMNPYPFGFI